MYRPRSASLPRVMSHSRTLSKRVFIYPSTSVRPPSCVQRRWKRADIPAVEPVRLRACAALLLSYFPLCDGAPRGQSSVRQMNQTCREVHTCNDLNILLTHAYTMPYPCASTFEMRRELRTV